MKKILLSLIIFLISQILLFGQSSTILGTKATAVDSSNTTALGFVAVDDAKDVAVAGNNAFVVNEDDGLHIIDISNSSVPVEVGHLTLGFSSASIVVDGNYAYIAAYSNGLRIIDISDVTNPTEVASYVRDWDNWSSASDVKIVGNLAYVAFGSSGLYVLDISDLANISSVASYTFAGITESIEVIGDYAYIVAGSSGLHILNISDLANLTEVGSFDTNGDARDLFISGDNVFIADVDKGLRIIDKSDFTNVTELGFYNPWEDLVGIGNVIGVTVSGDKAYLAAYDKGLQIVDISNISTPTEAGFYDLETNGGVRNNFVVNEMVYSVNEEGLYIIKYENTSDGVILTENFDSETFPPTGWTQTITNAENTWFQGNPTDNPFSDIDASNVYSALCPWVAEDQDEWLKSLVFALPDGILSLEFYAGYSADWLSYATMRLYISINGGSDWSQIWEADNDGEAWKWRKIDIDLSTYANNSNVMLAWQYVGNDGDMVGIDNVKIKQETTGLAELIVDDANFKVSNYPNPFSSKTTISLQLVEQSDIELTVYNSLGQKVENLFKGTLTAGDHQFNFDANGLKAGTYYYRIISNGSSSTKAMLLTD